MNNLATYELHKLAYLFPEMDAEQFEALKSDIRKNGQHQPILTFNGTVVDGRHRLKACRELGIAPRFHELECTETALLTRVLSENLHRRHLTASQRAMVAAVNLRESKQEIQKNVGIPTISGSSRKATQSVAARECKVSRDSVAVATKVLKQNERLAQQVLKGECSLEWANQQVNMAKAIVNGGTNAAAREIIEEQRIEQEYGLENSRWDGYVESAVDAIRKIRLFLEKHVDQYRPIASTEKSRDSEAVITRELAELAKIAKVKLGEMVINVN